MSSVYEKMYHDAMDEMADLRKLYEEKCKQLQVVMRTICPAENSFLTRKPEGSDVGDAEVVR